MPVSVTQAWEEAAATNDKSEVMLATLEFSHSAFLIDGQLAPVRVVRNTEDMVFKLEADAPVHAGLSVNFIAMPFEIEFPQIGRIGASCSIRIDNVGRELSPYLDKAVKVNEAVRVIMRGYLASDTNTVGLGPYALYLRNVKRTVTSLEGALIVANPRDRRVINDVYDMERFAALMAAAT